LAGVLLEDGNVVVPGGLGGAVGGQGAVVFGKGGDTGGVLGLGNLGWEVSDLSQVEHVGVVVFSVVEVSEAEYGGWLCYVVGDWDVGDVTVELGLDIAEDGGYSIAQGDWGLTWGHPSC